MAINFPTSPTVGSDYTYQGIKYTYQADGYWAVTTVGTQGVASPEDLNAGTDSVKYLTPTSFSGSKYDITISNFGSASQKDVGTAPDEVPTNSDLGTAAVRDVGIAAGDVMEVGAGGVLSSEATSFPNTADWRSIFDSGVKTGISYASGNPIVSYGVGRFNSNSPGPYLTETFILQGSLANKVFYGHFRKNQGAATLLEGLTKNVEGVGGAANTTVDGSGFIKEASPIVKLYSDKIELNDYKEIENCTFERVDTGHYIIKGAPLLSRNGWYIETLKDRNNNIYFTLDYEELEDGVHVKTYEPDYSTGRATNGAPVDINEGRFVTLRFEEDPSLYPAPEEEPDLNSKQP